MSNKSTQSTNKNGSSKSSDEKKLSCGGQACSVCNACRDWYLDRVNGGTVKRKGSNCIHENIFTHELVTTPKDESSYPLGRLICECQDNH